MINFRIFLGGGGFSDQSMFFITLAGLICFSYLPLALLTILLYFCPLSLKSMFAWRLLLCQIFFFGLFLFISTSTSSSYNSGSFSLVSVSLFILSIEISFSSTALQSACLVVRGNIFSLTSATIVPILFKTLLSLLNFVLVTWHYYPF